MQDMQEGTFAIEGGRWKEGRICGKTSTRVHTCVWFLDVCATIVS